MEIAFLGKAVATQDVADGSLGLSKLSATGTKSPAQVKLPIIREAAGEVPSVLLYKKGFIIRREIDIL